MSQENIQTFEYPAMPFVQVEPSVHGLEEISFVAENAHSELRSPQSPDYEIQIHQKLEEDMRQAFAAGRETGLTEGRELERQARSAALEACDEQRRKQIAEFSDRFALERDRYFKAVEQEVVRLALTVAARILRREAQMDPLLLTGAVRVALGQLSATTEARLLVPPAELELWGDAIAHLPNLTIRPMVVPTEGMHSGDCVIETSVGSVDLGVRSQLAEIESGFFDRSGKVGGSDVQSTAALERELMQK